MIFVQLCILLLSSSCLLLLDLDSVDAKKSSHYRTTVAEDPIISSSTATAKNVKQHQHQAHQQKHASKPVATSAASPPASSAVEHNHEFSIEDVDEEQIDEILRDSSKNLVVFFYDGRVKCPECGIALSEVEEIDDDIESTGYIEVVKTDDRRVARDCGVSTFPSLVYFRRSNPILYDGDFKDSENVLRWLRAHDEVATWDLNDDNFEYRTDSHSPPEGALDWLVMFYDSEEPDCNAFVPMFETVSHKLRGLVNAGKLDTSVSDDVAERFRIDESQCPTFLLFHRGKFFRYNDPAKDVRGLTAFALHKFKEQRGHRVPEPPTALEHFYEHVKERFSDAIEDNQKLTAICVGGAILIVSLCLAVKAYRIRSEQAIANGKRS